MTIESAFNKLLYWPICRFYARNFIGDKPADDLMRGLCSLQFWSVHHYWPDFVNPKRFSEKLWTSMLYERDPRYTLISDKLGVRKYVTSRINENYLIPLLWHGDKPEEIPFNILPEKFVIKANHGCGYNIIVESKSNLDISETKMKLRKWLDQNFCDDKYLGIAWGYKNIKPMIMIEKFLDNNGRVPDDYKFWCFAGKVEVVTIHFDRFVNHSFRSYDRNFEESAFGFGEHLPLYKGKFERPQNFDNMLQIVESLAEGFDFIRVDLYNLDKQIYFGELTPYPGGVSVQFLPDSMDKLLGHKWKTFSKR